jgi:hypothetical protein
MIEQMILAALAVCVLLPVLVLALAAAGLSRR